MTEDRPLSLAHATALVVASMIGTGVFTTAGLMMAELGSPPAVLIVWGAAGLLSLCGATVYAELGAMMPRAGGEYVYLTRAFHPAVGFVAGWVALTVGFSAPIAAGALAFGRYAHALAPALPERPAALLLVAAATLLHARDVRRGGLAQAVLTALVTAVILAFIVVCVAAAATRGADQVEWGRLLHADAALPLVSAHAGVSAGAVAVSLVYVSYSYFGWNAAAYVAGEVRDPARTLPRAFLAGTALVTVLYVALNAVFLAAVPASELAGRVEVADVAARALLGPRGGAVLSALVALGLAGSVSALMMTGPRVVQAMAQAGQLFGVLARVNRHGAPAAAVLLQGALAALGVVTAAFEPLLVYVGFLCILSSAATVAGAFVLRRREPDAPRPYRARGWPLTGIAYLALALFITVLSVRARPRESAAGLATLALGAGAWFVWRRR